MPDIQPPAPAVTPAPAAPTKVVPEPAQKTREQLAMDALGTVPDAPDPYAEETPVAADEPAETPEAPPAEAAPTEPPPAAPVVKDFALIAAQRRAQAAARRVPPKAAPAPQNDAMAEALRLITERLAPPKPPEVTPEMELSLEALARQTGKPVREIYALLTNQLAGKAGPLKVPVAPPSAESRALSELREQLAAEKSAREAMESKIAEAGKEWQEQQRQAEMRQSHVQLSQQFVGYVEQNKAKFPFTAAADPAEVGEALALATANLRTPLTADQLVSRMEGRLKADYERLSKAVVAKGAPAAPQAPSRSVTPQQPPVPPQRAVATAKKPFVIPPELHGVRGVSSAAEADRIKRAMDLLVVTADEE